MGENTNVKAVEHVRLEELLDGDISILPLEFDHLFDLGHLKGDKAVGEFVEALFAAGDTVRVIDGPFASFDGTVEDYDQVRQRLRVVVSIFGRSTPLDLEDKQVEAA